MRVILSDRNTYEKNLDGGLVMRGWVLEDGLQKTTIDISKAELDISKSELQDIIDQFYLFLCTGFLRININRAMVFLYLAIELDVKKLIN